jgi:hypothetical protein
MVELKGLNPFILYSFYTPSFTSIELENIFFRENFFLFIFHSLLFSGSSKQQKVEREIAFP